MARTAQKHPIIAIIGATGTGKSQLAVSLAERFHGEVINGDALQLYKGLPIATNKVSVDEMRGIPHHLLGCIGLNEEPWAVGRFVEEARKIVDEIIARGKLPILVGGTHYYTQALLFENAVVAEPHERISTEEQESKWPVLAGSGEEMLHVLRQIDPVMAAKWHPRDSRKIRRSLEIWLTTGKKASDVYAEQREAQRTVGSDGTNGGDLMVGLQSGTERGGEAIDHKSSFLRFDTLIFWVYREIEGLDERLSSRVDGMIEQGLLAEIEYLNAIYHEQQAAGLPVDTTKGIWVAIGYKEFQEYFEAVRNGGDPSQLAHTRRAGVDLTKIATRQYARKQNRWIRRKLFQALADIQQTGSMFLLDRNGDHDATDSVAEKITHDFLAGLPLDDPRALSSTASSILNPLTERVGQSKNDTVRHCELCGTSVATAKSWADHLNSKRHKGMLKPRARYDGPSREAVGEIKT
ncbi:hypothetical protein MMC13_001466 [Lambiella insularis]|nr:hypothetical protein [Lambiella insularis]